MIPNHGIKILKFLQFFGKMLKVFTLQENKLFLLNVIPEINPQRKQFLSNFLSSCFKTKGFLFENHCGRSIDAFGVAKI